MALEDLGAAPIPTVGDAGLFVTTGTYAGVYGISEQTARRLCREGRVPAVRVGKTWRIPLRAITDQIQGAVHD